MIKLSKNPFNPYQELAKWTKIQENGKYGACCNFIGTMRDFNLSDNVTHMSLQHYDKMTIKQLENITKICQDKFKIIDSLMIHRIGDIEPNDTIVLIATISAHRDEAFKSCRFLIEELKHKATFWKQETLKNTQKRWVLGN
ncbi:MAG: molybdenum cofactor biosynthesis protein MoaE [Gammaproteobacteria bacterium]|nr:MAG: molybdenum cofactor biosynthesis protein MoaE [Gammaproteobacteria bacterium]